MIERAGIKDRSESDRIRDKEEVCNVYQFNISFLLNSSKNLMVGSK